MTVADGVWAALWLCIGFLAGSLLRPGLARLERISRRLWNEDPLIVYIESDPEVIFANAPDWECFTRWLPDARDLALTGLPEGRWDWLRWVKDRGGQDAQTSKLGVTLQAKTEAAVIVDAVRVNVSRKDTPAGGIVLTRSVGGADLTELFITIYLDAGSEDPQNPLMWLGGDGMPKSRVLAAGDVERFQIIAEAKSGWFEWTLELHLLVEGRRVIRKVDDGGRPFVTVGADGMDHLYSDGDTVRSSID